MDNNKGCLIALATVVWIIVIVVALFKAPVIGFIFLAAIVIAAICTASGRGDGTNGRHYW